MLHANVRRGTRQRRRTARQTRARSGSWLPDRRTPRRATRRGGWVELPQRRPQPVALALPGPDHALVRRGQQLDRLGQVTVDSYWAMVVTVGAGELGESGSPVRPAALGATPRSWRCRRRTAAGSVPAGALEWSAALTFIAVRQQQDDAAALPPLRLCSRDELVDDRPRTVTRWPSSPSRRPGPRSKIASGLGRGGRQRRIEERAEQIQAALRADHLEAPSVVADAMGASVRALVAVISNLSAQIVDLETELATVLSSVVRGRPDPLPRGEVSPELRQHVTDHECARQPPRHPRPLRAEPTTRRRLLPMGVRRDHRQRRRPAVLRPATHRAATAA